MFWECRYVRLFWESVESLFNGKIGPPITLESMFLGDDNSTFCTVIFNAKRYIFMCFKEKRYPSIFVLKQKLLGLSKIEKHIFLKQGKCDLWFKKWKIIIDVL